MYGRIAVATGAQEITSGDEGVSTDAPSSASSENSGADEITSASGEVGGGEITSPSLLETASASRVEAESERPSRVSSRTSFSLPGSTLRGGVSALGR